MKFNIANEESRRRYIKFIEEGIIEPSEKSGINEVSIDKDNIINISYQDYDQSSINELNQRINELVEERKAAKAADEKDVIFKKNTEIKQLRSKVQTIKKLFGGFYPFKISEKIPDHIKKYLKERCQITNDISDEIFNINCLSYSIKTSNILNAHELNNFIFQTITREINSSQLEKLALMFNIHFVIYNRESKQTIHYPKNYKDIECLKEIKLNYLHNHFFIYEKFEGVSNYKIVEKYTTSKRFTYYELIKAPSCLEFRDEIRLDPNYSYDDNFKKYQPKTIKKFNKKEQYIVYADTEATTDGNIHKCYYIAYSHNGIIKRFKGWNCLYEFMNDLNDVAKDYELILYFHNLAYDIRQFHNFKFINMIEKNNKVFSCQIYYKSAIYYFRDTLALMNFSLKKCGEIFIKDLKVKKELFPYSSYTTRNIETALRNNNLLNLYTILKTQKSSKLDDHWEYDEVYEFINNCLDIKCIYDKYGKIDYEDDETYDNLFDNPDEYYIDIFEYCGFYCGQDVNVLEKAFTEFRNKMIETINIDPINFLTIPSIANHLLVNV